MAAAQAQKHVTLNETLEQLDSLVACCVKSRSASSPPADLAEGDAYVVPVAGLGGACAGAGTGDLLRWQAGTWSVEPSPVGLLAFVDDEASVCVRDVDGWRPLGERLGSAQSLELLGVGTTADAAHPLAVKLNAVLFTALPQEDREDGHLRLTLNKQAGRAVLCEPVATCRSEPSAYRCA